MPKYVKKVPKKLGAKSKKPMKKTSTSKRKKK